MILSVTKLSITTLCHYAESHCAEYRNLFSVILNVIMLSVVMLNVVMLSIMTLILVLVMFFNLFKGLKKPEVVKMTYQNNLDALKKSSLAD